MRTKLPRGIVNGYRVNIKEGKSWRKFLESMPPGPHGKKHKPIRVRPDGTVKTYEEE